MLRTLFEDLSNKACSLRELAMKNIRYSSGDNLDGPTLTAVMGNIEQFSLYFYDGRHVMESKAPRVLQHMSALPATYLSHNVSNMTRLDLGFDSYWGFFPRLELSGLHFPDLRVLKLRKFTIWTEDQVEWIVTHGSTLRRLILDHCPILVKINTRLETDRKGYPKQSGLFMNEPAYRNHEFYWSEVFSTFKNKLPKLEYFASDSGDKVVSKPTLEAAHMGISKRMYRVYGQGLISKNMLTCRLEIDLSKSDGVALASLMEKTGQHRWAKFLRARFSNDSAASWVKNR